MMACEIPREEMMPGLVSVHSDASGCDFSCARDLAVQHARTFDSDPMLLSWFDRRREAFSPHGECCADDEPSWLTYALSRGGNLSISVDEGDYYFIFKEAHLFR